MKPRTWKRLGKRVFEFSTGDLNAVIFGSSVRQMWAWGVWSNQPSAEGIAFSLSAAREKANAKIDEVESKVTA